MKIKWYIQSDTINAGMTLKHEQEAEMYNMALHACQNEEQIIKNRENLASIIHCYLDDFVCAEQTHRPHFYRVTKKDKGRGARTMADAIPNTDALYTYEPNIVVTACSADCVPILFYHPSTGVIGAIHSGWQGTVKEISRKLFHHLIEEENADPDGFHVHIGMALSQEKFEVDEDVYDRFHQLGYAEEYMYYNKKTNKYHIDNQRTVKKQCELTGIPSEQITIDRTCTYMSPNGFSYREDKLAGRHLSFIVKRK